MRPIRKATARSYVDGRPYQEARSDLVSRIGNYCSYCERRLEHLIHIEHIRPKDPNPDLETVWTNFLLSCVNCNSLKSAQDIGTNEWLIPDRDNTAVAFAYTYDGKVEPAPNLARADLAQRTIDLFQMNRVSSPSDRVSGRMEVRVIAERQLQAWQTNPSPELKDAICNLAKYSGFFSVWMQVFHAYVDIRLGIIGEYPGTLDSGCFSPTGSSVSPAPNPDALENGSKC